MHRIFELLSIPRIPGSSRLELTDVRVKLIVAIAAILAVVVATRVWLPLLSAGVCLAALVAFRAPWRITVFRLTASLGVAAVICLLQALMTGTTPLLSLPIWHWRLTVTQEGLWSGALIGCRVLGSVSILVVLGAFTQVYDIFAALRWAKLPRTWVEIAMLMVRSIFTLFQQAANVVSAQKVRLGHSTARRSLASMGSLAGIVLLRSFDQAERTHEAMVARGYQGSLPIPRLAPLTKADWAKCTIGVLVVAAAYVLAERWPL
jgi:cobalt/nickel transport system permease protein